MSFFKEPQPLTPSEEAERDEIQREDYLHGLYENFFFTGDLKELAAFVREGGDIDEYNLRENLAELIGSVKIKNPGGSKDEVNIAFYMAVEGRMLERRRKSISKVDDAKDLTLDEKFALHEKVGKTAAVEEVAAEVSKGLGISREGGWSRYKKGKELFILKFGRTWN